MDQIKPRPRTKKKTAAAFVYKPRSPQFRSVSRDTLLQGLQEEITKGNSRAKLYASLLMKELWRSEEKLQKKFPGLPRLW